MIILEQEDKEFYRLDNIAILLWFCVALQVIDKLLRFH